MSTVQTRDARTFLLPFWPSGEPAMFVDGRWTAGSGPRVPTYDPSTGEVLAHVPDANAADVDAAVRAAERAQPAWAALTLEQRADALAAVADALDTVGQQLVMLEAADSGNPLSSTRRDLGLMIRYLQAWPALAAGRAGRFDRPGPDMLSLVTHQPYGVVGRIVAFNHPSLFALGGSIFALVAGNTVVVKAAPQTPLATLALGAVAAVLPPGVLNLISGGTQAGDALVVHPTVPRLAFTGSLPSALAIQNRLSASGTVKHLSTELGGKNAMVVFPDADFDGAVDAAAAGMSLTVSAGQSCQATSRLLVHESLAADFVERLAVDFDRLRIGRAYDEGTEMGPLVSAAQLARVEEFCADAVTAGARVRAGAQPRDRVPDGGYFLRPVLYDQVSADMRIAREEVFGPVLSVLTWDRYDDMIAMANDSTMGLSAAVWSRDIDRALNTAADIQAGYVWVNDANRHYLGAPFGGTKSSGTGREESIEELDSFRQPKSINIRLGSV